MNLINTIDRSLKELINDTSFFAVWLLIFNVIDYLCTKYILKEGLDLELNLIVNYFGLNTTFFIKMILCSGLIIFFIKHSNTNCFIHFLLKLAVFIYFILCVCHIYYIFL